MHLDKYSFLVAASLVLAACSSVKTQVDKVHTEQSIKGGSRAYFEVGTLVIDFVNPKTSKLLKRASISAPILRNLPEDVRQERLQSIVDEALKDLRVAS